MQINLNELDGADEFLSSPNTAWATRVKNLLLYRQLMEELYGLKANFDWAVKFSDPANDWNASVYLSKLIDDVELFDQEGKKMDVLPDDHQSIKTIAMIYQGHYRVHFMPATEHNKNAAFLVKDFIYDYASSNEKEAEWAIVERAKSALLLAQNAKALGWTSVNFYGTKTPLERYCLQKACEKVGLDCTSEVVDLPKGNISKVLNVSIESAVDQIFKTLESDFNIDILLPEAQSTTEEAPQNSNDFTATDDELNDIFGAHSKKERDEESNPTDENSNDDLDDLDAFLQARNNNNHPQGPSPTP